jgi:hypothetical protein
MKFLELQNVGLIAFTGLAAVGFAGAALTRVRLAMHSHRSGNRTELIRSSAVALVMSLFTALAAYTTIARIVVSLGANR